MSDAYILFILCSGLIIVACGRILRHKHPNAVYLLFYFFFFTACATWLINEFAIAIGALNEMGMPQSTFGSFLRYSLLKAMFDLNPEFRVLIGAITIVVLPQLLTYLACGLFGCASPPRWVSGIINFVLLFLAKSSACAGGLVFSLAFVVVWKKWPMYGHPDTKTGAYVPFGTADVIMMLLGALMLLASAFLFLFLRYEIDEDFGLPKKLQAFIEATHKRAVRFSDPDCDK